MVIRMITSNPVLKVIVVFSIGASLGHGGLTALAPATNNAIPSPCSQCADDWSLRLESAKLSKTGIVELRATLVNLSNDKVTIYNNSLATELAHRVRIWSRNTDGSYSILLRSQSGVFFFSRSNTVVGPHEAITLIWPTSLESNSGLECLYQLVYHKRIFPTRRECDSALLEPGDYVVDASLQLDVSSGTRSLPIDSRVQILLQSDNKLWVSVEREHAVPEQRRGRAAGCPAVPAQIPASGTTAPGLTSEMMAFVIRMSFLPRSCATSLAMRAIRAVPERAHNLDRPPIRFEDHAELDFCHSPRGRP